HPRRLRTPPPRTPPHPLALARSKRNAFTSVHPHHRPPTALRLPHPLPRTPGHFETHPHVPDSGAEPSPRAGPIPPLHVERQRRHDGGEEVTSWARTCSRTSSTVRCGRWTTCPATLCRRR